MDYLNLLLELTSHYKEQVREFLGLSIACAQASPVSGQSLENKVYAQVGFSYFHKYLKTKTCL